MENPNNRAHTFFRVTGRFKKKCVQMTESYGH